MSKLAHVPFHLSLHLLTSLSSFLHCLSSQFLAQNRRPYLQTVLLPLPLLPRTCPPLLFSTFSFLPPYSFSPSIDLRPHLSSFSSCSTTFSRILPPSSRSHPPSPPSARSLCPTSRAFFLKSSSRSLAAYHHLHLLLLS